MFDKKEKPLHNIGRHVGNAFQGHKHGTALPDGNWNGAQDQEHHVDGEAVNGSMWWTAGGPAPLTRGKIAAANMLINLQY